MKFHFYRDVRGEHRWRLVAQNGRILADSAEGYTEQRGAVEALDGILDNVTEGHYEVVHDKADA